MIHARVPRGARTRCPMNFLSRRMCWVMDYLIHEIISMEPRLRRHTCVRMKAVEGLKGRFEGREGLKESFGGDV